VLTKEKVRVRNLVLKRQTPFVVLQSDVFVHHQKIHDRLQPINANAQVLLLLDRKMKGQNQSAEQQIKGQQQTSSATASWPVVVLPKFCSRSWANARLKSSEALWCCHCVCSRAASDLHSRMANE
jgi:hypothetical protein